LGAPFFLCLLSLYYICMHYMYYVCVMYVFNVYGIIALSDRSFFGSHVGGRWT